MLLTSLIILFIVDAVWIGYEMKNAPVIDDEDVIFSETDIV